MNKEIYLVRNGNQIGPFSTVEIHRMVDERSASLSSLAWRNGLSQWVPLSQILESTNIEKLPAIAESEMHTTSIIHDGIGRFAYVGAIIGIFVVSVLFMALLGREYKSLASILTCISMLAPMVLRLKNIGKSGWWALLSFVPLVGLYVVAICLAAPRGYAQSRKLDMPGKIVVWSFIGLMTFAIISVFSAAGSR